MFCNVSIEDVIETVDVKTIYEAPISFNKEKLDERVLKFFNIKSRKKVNLLPWKRITKLILNTKNKVNIAIIGKYVELKDAYRAPGGLQHLRVGWSVPREHERAGDALHRARGARGGLKKLYQNLLKKNLKKKQPIKNI